MSRATHLQTSPTFDVIRVDDSWAIKGPRGFTIISAASQKVAIALAWVAAMYLRPANVRLLTTDGQVEKGWSYPA